MQRLCSTDPTQEIRPTVDHAGDAAPTRPGHMSCLRVDQEYSFLHKERSINSIKKYIMEKGRIDELHGDVRILPHQSCCCAYWSLPCDHSPDFSKPLHNESTLLGHGSPVLGTKYLELVWFCLRNGTTALKGLMSQQHLGSG